MDYAAHLLCLFYTLALKRGTILSFDQAYYFQFQIILLFNIRSFYNSLLLPNTFLTITMDVFNCSEIKIDTPFVDVLPKMKEKESI